MVGRIWRALTDRGLEGRTLVVFSSDNGLLMGEHGLAGKWLIYEEAIRIPLIIYHPALPANRWGSVVEEMVLNIDVAPTILELAAVTVPGEMQGRSLRPLLFGEGVAWRRLWLYEQRFTNGRIPVAEGVRTERWKYVRYRDCEPAVEQLFDLRTDPQERLDRSTDERLASVLERLRTEASRFLRQAR